MGKMGALRLELRTSEKTNALPNWATS